MSDKFDGTVLHADQREERWVVFSSVLCVATTAAAVRLIFNNARIYHFFADM